MSHRFLLERDIDLLRMQYDLTKQEAVKILHAHDNLDRACEYMDKSRQTRAIVDRKAEISFDIETVSRPKSYPQDHKGATPDEELQILTRFYDHLGVPHQVHIEQDAGPLNQTVLVKGVWHPLIENCPVVRNTLDGHLGSFATIIALSDPKEMDMCSQRMSEPCSSVLLDVLKHEGVVRLVGPERVWIFNPPR